MSFFFILYWILDYESYNFIADHYRLHPELYGSSRIIPKETPVPVDNDFMFVINPRGYEKCITFLDVRSPEMQPITFLLSKTSSDLIILPLGVNLPSNGIKYRKNYYRNFQTEEAVFRQIQEKSIGSAAKT